MDGSDEYARQRLVGRERRQANRSPGSAYREGGRNGVPLVFAGSAAGPEEVFRSLPRVAVQAFTGRRNAPLPRYVLLLPMEAGTLGGALNLAVILGRSLRYMPELKAREERFKRTGLLPRHSCPRELMMSELESLLRKGDYQSRDELIARMARAFDVSNEAMGYRLINLSVITA